MREAIGRGAARLRRRRLPRRGVRAASSWRSARPCPARRSTGGAGACGADGRETLVRAYPISVDAEEFDDLVASPAVRAAEDALFDDRPEHVILRVDRTDPSKNIVRGLKAFDRLLEERPEWRDRVRFLVLLDPSRLEVPEYADYLAAIQRTARAVGERWAASDGTPAIDLRIHDNFPESVAAYRSVRRAAGQRPRGWDESDRQGSPARQRPGRRPGALGDGRRARRARAVRDQREPVRHPGPGRRAARGARAARGRAGAPLRRRCRRTCATHDVRAWLAAPARTTSTRWRAR